MCKQPVYELLLPHCHKIPQRSKTHLKQTAQKMHSDKYVFIVSECTVTPHSKSSMDSLRLTVSDLSLLSFQYIQKGCLFSGQPSNEDTLLSLLKLSLSKTLSVYPPLAGRLSTDSLTGHISVACSDDGALFIHARASHLFISDLLDPNATVLFRPFFALDDTLNYDGHAKPIAAVQVTFLGDGLFIGCSVNHAVVDGTSFWNFFNTFAEICRGETKISRPPCFSRDNVFFTDVALRFPKGRPEEAFRGDRNRLRERVFHFSRRSILKIKKKANEMNGDVNGGSTAEISSYLALCAQMWKSITRARNLPPTKTTTVYLPVNCRQRVNPNMDPLYFGNAIQIPYIVSLAGELLMRELGWSADLLRRSAVAHDDRRVRELVDTWVRDLHCSQLLKIDDATIVVGSSPRFPVYDCDFGWGAPVAVRSGKAAKPDGKITAFPGREGDGSVEFEVVLAAETMARLEEDLEFMQYVS